MDTVGRESRVERCRRPRSRLDVPPVACGLLRDAAMPETDGRWLADIPVPHELVAPRLAEGVDDVSQRCLVPGDQNVEIIGPLLERPMAFCRASSHNVGEPAMAGSDMADQGGNIPVRAARDLPVEVPERRSCQSGTFIAAVVAV